MLLYDWLLGQQKPEPKIIILKSKKPYKKKGSTFYNYEYNMHLEHTYDKNGSDGPAFSDKIFAKFPFGIKFVWKFI